MNKTLLTTLMAAASSLLLVLTAPAQAAASETRAASGFDAIAVSGAIDLTVRQGSAEGLELKADDATRSLVETVVDDHTLTIRFKPGAALRRHGPVRVTVDVIRLQSIASSGSGDVLVEALNTPALKLALTGASDARLRKLATDSLEVRISGSGDIVAAGTAKQVQLRIAGSGDAKLSELVADAVAIDIAGSGDADVTANKSLAVKIAGSGDVRYGGTVTAVQSSVAGSGSIERR